MSDIWNDKPFLVQKGFDLNRQASDIIWSITFWKKVI